MLYILGEHSINVLNAQESHKRIEDPESEIMEASSPLLSSPLLSLSFLSFPFLSLYFPFLSFPFLFLYFPFLLQFLSLCSLSITIPFFSFLLFYILIFPLLCFALLSALLYLALLSFALLVSFPLHCISLLFHLIWLPSFSWLSTPALFSPVAYFHPILSSPFPSCSLPSFLPFIPFSTPLSFRLLIFWSHPLHSFPFLSFHYLSSPLRSSPFLFLFTLPTGSLHLTHLFYWHSWYRERKIAAFWQMNIVQKSDKSSVDEVQLRSIFNCPYESDK